MSGLLLASLLLTSQVTRLAASWVEVANRPVVLQTEVLIRWIYHHHLHHHHYCIMCPKLNLHQVQD